MGTVVLFLMQVLEILVQTAMLRCGVRLRVKVFVYVVEVMMEPPMSTGPQAGRQQGGQWEADQERFLEHRKQRFLALDLHDRFLFADFFSRFLPVLAQEEHGRRGARLRRQHDCDKPDLRSPRHHASTSPGSRSRRSSTQLRYLLSS
jgi:hypothetical protein